MRVTAAVVDELGGPFRVEELDLDEPGPGEALVRVVASGICHTDEITRHGDLPMPFPSVLGHEGAGVVEAVGDGVTAVRPGDHVVIGWPSCGRAATAATASRATAPASARRWPGAGGCSARAPGRARCGAATAPPCTATSSASPRSRRTR